MNWWGRLWVRELMARIGSYNNQIAQNDLHPRELTWQWEILHLKMYFLLKIGIFQCHVSFQGCKNKKPFDSLIMQSSQFFLRVTNSGVNCYQVWGGLENQNDKQKLPNKKLVFWSYTPPKFNITDLSKSALPKRKVDLPTILFRAMVEFWGVMNKLRWKITDEFAWDGHTKIWWNQSWWVLVSLVLSNSWYDLQHLYILSIPW